MGHKSSKDVGPTHHTGVFKGVTVDEANNNKPSSPEKTTIKGSLVNQLYDVRPPSLTEEQHMMEKEFTAAYMDACYRALANDDACRSFAPNERFQLVLDTVDFSDVEERQQALREVISVFYYDILKVCKSVIDWEDALRLHQGREGNESRSFFPTGSGLSTSYTLHSESSVQSSATVDCPALAEATISYKMTSGRVLVRNGFLFLFWQMPAGEKIGYLESRASRWVLEAGVPGLHVPLTYHVRYKGRGVSVMALAPVSESLTFVTEQNIEVATMAQQLASAFSLVPYTSLEGDTGGDGRTSSSNNYELTSSLFFLPKLVQAHFGRDGRYYFFNNRRWFPQWLQGRYQPQTSLFNRPFSCVRPLLLASRDVKLSCRTFMADAFIFENQIALEFMKGEIDFELFNLISKVREKQLEKVKRKKAKKALQIQREHMQQWKRLGSMEHMVVVEEGGAGDHSRSSPAFSVSEGRSATVGSSLPGESELTSSSEESEEDENSINLYATGSIVEEFNAMGYPKCFLGILYLTLTQHASPPTYMVREVKREIYFRGLKDFIISRAYEIRFPNSHLSGNAGVSSTAKENPLLEPTQDEMEEEMFDDGPNDGWEEDLFYEDDVLLSGAPRPGRFMEMFSSFANQVRRFASLFVGHPTLAPLEQRAPSGKQAKKEKSPQSVAVTDNTPVANPLLSSVRSFNSTNQNIILEDKTFQSVMEKVLMAFMEYNGDEISDCFYYRAETEESLIWNEMEFLRRVFKEMAIPFIFRKFNLPLHLAPGLWEPLQREDKEYVYHELCTAFGVTIVDGSVKQVVPVVKDYTPRLEKGKGKKMSSPLTTGGGGEVRRDEEDHFIPPRWIRVQTRQLLRHLYYRKEATHREWDLYGAALIPFMSMQRHLCWDDELPENTPPLKRKKRYLPSLKRFGPVLLKRVSNMSSSPALLWVALAEDCFLYDEEEAVQLFRHNRMALANINAFGLGTGLDLAIDLRRGEIRSFNDRCIHVQLLRRHVRVLWKMEHIPPLPIEDLLEESGRCFRPFPPAPEAPPISPTSVDSATEDLHYAVSLAQEVVVESANILQHLGNNFSLQYHRFTSELLYSIHCTPTGFPLLEGERSASNSEESIVRNMMTFLRKYCTQDILAANDLLHRGVQLFERAVKKSGIQGDPVLSAELPADTEIEHCFRSAAEVYSTFAGPQSPQTLRALGNLAFYYFSTRDETQWKETVWRLRQAWSEDGPEDIRALLTSTQQSSKLWGGGFFLGGSDRSLPVSVLFRPYTS